MQYQMVISLQNLVEKKINNPCAHRNRSNSRLFPNRLTRFRIFQIHQNTRIAKRVYITRLGNTIWSIAGFR